MKLKIKDINDCASLWWSISKACNFSCSYCIQKDKSGERIDKNEALNVARHLKKMFDKCKYKNIKMSITGGEPSLYDLPQIVDILQGGHYNLTLCVLTNFSLRDADWWNSLQRENVTVGIVASCHIEQISNIEEWLSKAKKLTNIKSFKAKFVVTNENFESTKQIVKKCEEYGINYCLEGARGKLQMPLFNDEVKNYIASSNSRNSGSKNTLFEYGDEKLTRTELILKMHKDVNCPVECVKRLTIRGNMAESGCPYKYGKRSIYEIESLDWDVVEKCNLVQICNLCQVGEIRVNDKI